MTSAYGAFHSRPPFGRRTTVKPVAQRAAPTDAKKTDAKIAQREAPQIADEFQGGFSIGGVISSAFGVLGSNGVTFIALLALAAIPERALYHFSGLDGKVLNLATSLTLSLTGLLLHLAVMRLTIDAVGGGRATLGSAVGQALRTFFPALGLGLLAVVPLGLGCLLLVVPGVMLSLSWSLIVPVRIAEGAGLIDCFKRSSALTRGHRWQILAIFVILGFVLGLLFFVLQLLWGMPPQAFMIFFSQNWLARLLCQAAGALVLATTYAALAKGSSVDLDAFD